MIQRYMMQKTHQRWKKYIKIFMKDKIKKSITVLIIFLFALSILSRQDTKNTDMQFVRNFQETTTHNAASSQRDYLFENEGNTSWNQIYQGTINTWSTGSITTNLVTGKVIDNKDNTIKIYTGQMIPTTGQDIQKEDILSTGRTCTTPRNETVKNNDFVLAYQQRDDVETMCNVQKRVCENGVLQWTFTQNSCKDDLLYSYKKIEPISYNQKIVNEYIQPNEAPNKWAYFSNDGKIGEEKAQTTTRWNTINTTTSTDETQQSSIPSKASCITPRGQTVQHGQFIKAYKAPRWFIDLECEVELRPCVNGVLKGNFNYATCNYINTTYNDYLQNKSPLDGTWFLFFERIKSTLRRGE